MAGRIMRSIVAGRNRIPMLGRLLRVVMLMLRKGARSGEHSEEQREA
jgi:hypothetical protein